MRIDYLVKYLVIAVLVSLIAGCNSDRSTRDLKEYIENLKKSETANQKKIKSVELPVPVPAVYRATNLRAPVEGATVQADAATKTAELPLQSYPISVLRFVGSITEEGIAIAYIQAPDNMIYSVKKGDALGDHNGRVIGIEPNRVSVMEQVLEPGKQPIGRVVTLQLKDTP